MSPELKDLIDKLLQVNPVNRLGAGIEEGNGMEELKKHPFFKGINFTDLHTKTVPVPENLRFTLAMIKKANDVPIGPDELDSDDDSVKQPSAGLQKSQSNALLKTQKPSIEMRPQKLGLKEENSSSSQRSRKEEIVNERIAELRDSKYSTGVIKESTLEKRNKWYFFQDRNLKLTKDLRLMYYKKDSYRSDIILSKKVTVRKEKPHHFEIITPNKIFHFRCKEGDSATEWVKLIKQALKTKIQLDRQAKH